MEHTAIVEANRQYRELACRSADGVDVRLLWVRVAGDDELVVCVCDTRAGAYFEIRPERHRALEVYYHPFAYRDLSTVDYEDERLAAA